jgi:hypothetical protein
VDHLCEHLEGHVPTPTQKAHLREASTTWRATLCKKRQLRTNIPPHPATAPPMASQQAADATAPSATAVASGEAPPSDASSTLAQNATAAATAATDLEKKMRRAERFGTPVVMSEEEKRSSRAER